MKNILINIATLLFSSFLGITALIEFNHQLKAAKIEVDKINWAKLPLHDSSRHFCKGEKDQVMLDKERVFIERPNSEYFQYKNNKVFLLSNDRNGQRINQANLSKYKEHIGEEVWVFGDSFTYGVIADNTETIPAFLSMMNNENINFKNNGVSGYGSINSLLTFKWALNKFKESLPKKIIFIAHTNDLFDDLRTKNRLLLRNESSNKNLELKNQLKSLLSTFKISRLLLNYYETRRQSSLSSINKIFESQSTSQSDYILDSSITKETIVELIEIAKKNKITPYLYFLPGLVVEEEYKFANTYDSLLLEIAEDYNIQYVKIDDNYLESNMNPSDAYKTAKDLYGYPDTHYNEYGNFILAKVIASSLMKDSSISFELNTKFKNRTNYTPGEERCPD